jgi:phosphatidylglycerol:prolipoprotein diacylglycerol transferase
VLNFPQINPIAVTLGPLKIRWYGLMYLLGFGAAWFLGKKRAKKPWSSIKPEMITDLVTYAAFGVILGGRIGYILFYNFGEFVNNPLLSRRSRR